MRRWKRFGHDRVYVNLPDGTTVAWANLATGELQFEHPQYRREALELIRPYLQRGASSAGAPSSRSPVHEPPSPTRAPRPTVSKLPTLTPQDDLASNQPGAGLAGLLAGKGQTPMRRIWSRLLGRTSEWESWHKGLAGERRVGRELERLHPFGWRVLHGIPTPTGGDIDHLLIGPGGVFVVNAKYHDGKSVWLGDHAAKVNHGRPQPYANISRSEARRVREVLERYCEFPVHVEPVLVFVGVTDLTKAPTAHEVRAYKERDIASLAPLSGKLCPEQVEAVYTVARHKRVWLNA
ncbi:NERD domain-containing protein [Streptomyces coeruleoprunus]